MEKGRWSPDGVVVATCGISVIVVEFVRWCVLIIGPWVVHLSTSHNLRGLRPLSRRLWPLGLLHILFGFALSFKLRGRPLNNTTRAFPIHFHTSLMAYAYLYTYIAIRISTRTFFLLSIINLNRKTLFFYFRSSLYSARVR